MEAQKQKSCEDLIDNELRKEIETIRNLWESYQEGEDFCEEEGGLCFHEYGLSFDYVPAQTFENKGIGYFRYQISWGGPSDEFRFYCDPTFNCHLIEYSYQDWFDGATRELEGSDKDLLLEIFDYFHECEATVSAMSEALEE